jgi:hypothetical protein
MFVHSRNISMVINSGSGTGGSMMQSEWAACSLNPATAISIYHLTAISAMDPPLISQRGARSRSYVRVLVCRLQSIAQFLAGSEKRHPLTRYIYRITGAGVATRAGVALTRRESAETPQFHSATFYQT